MAHKKTISLTSDRISQLPDNLREEILMRMPIQDAVRTSVLSRKWRYAWVTLPQLIFDESFYRQSRRKLVSKLMKTKLMNAIYQVLLLHHGPILKFKLSLSRLEISEIDQLILFVSNNGIQEFILDIWKREIYKLPSSIFSCQQLKHLKLRACSLNPPPRFEGFSKLLSLELRCVDITDKVLSSLISSCPLLEELHYEDDILWNSGCLEIAAPNLRCLFYHSTFSSICFKNLPKLARVSLQLNCRRGDVKLATVSASLPVIEFLELSHGTLQLFCSGGVERQVPTDLSHLKILKLYDVNLKRVEEVSNIICFIRSCPNLEKIVIWAYCCRNDESVQKFLEEQGWWGISLNQLQEVELKPVSSKGFELELLKVLLATSPALEHIVIVTNLLKATEKVRFLKKMRGYMHLSARTKVTCKKT